MKASLKPRAKLVANAELETQELGWLRRQHAQLAALDDLKAIKHQLALESEAIDGMLRNNTGTPQPCVLECLRSRGVARQRALRLARAKLPGAVINNSIDLLDIRWLAPHDHLIAQPQCPEEYQSNITTHIGLYGLTVQALLQFGAAGYSKRARMRSDIFCNSRKGQIYAVRYSKRQRLMWRQTAMWFLLTRRHCIYAQVPAVLLVISFTVRSLAMGAIAFTFVLAPGWLMQC